MPLPTDLFPAERLVIDPAERLTYESDAGLDAALPDAVVFPESADEVARLVRWAGEHGVPLVARGAGTGLAGGAVATEGGIVVTTSRMDRVVELDRRARQAVVEPGVVNLTLAERAAAADLYYPPDPASGRSCLLGGNIATNAGGPHCFKYGVTTHYVLGLEVVLADGERLELGGAALDPPGYDLRGLMVGSEGTLGIVTGARLRLLRRPPGVGTLMVAFDSLAAAGAAVSAVIAAGLTPAALEVIDRSGMRVIEDFCAPGLPVEAGAALILEVDGYRAGLDAQLDEAARLLVEHGGHGLRTAADEQERQAIWHGRKSAAGAMARLAPSYYLTDITVRRSRLAPVLARVGEICRGHRLRSAAFFHAGDGNLHPLIPCDPRDAAEMERVHRAMAEIVELCIAEDGSISGEHGIGAEKREQMAQMHGAAELEAMRDVKEAFDPRGLLNPGKVLPAAPARGRRQQARRPPGTRFEPATAEEAAAGLAGLSASGCPVWLGDAASEAAADRGEVVVSSGRLRGIRELALDDRFVRVGAGTPLAEVHAALAASGSMLPVTSPWPTATVGGVVAECLEAPHRMRYGSLRDLVLDATVALADGRVIRTGRPLVKNVAGYDLTKVFVGSRGTLGLLCEVTLQLVPRPRSRRTLELTAGDLGRALERAERALPVALVSSAIVIEAAAAGGAPWRWLYTAEGLESESAAELAELAAALGAAGGELRTSDRSGSEAWAAFLGEAAPDELLVRIAVPPSELASTAERVAAELGDRLLLDVAAAQLFLRLPVGTVAAAEAVLSALRAQVAPAGHVAALAGPRAIVWAIDRWGGRPAGWAVMRRLKARWDPQGILGGGFLDLPLPAA